VGRLATYKYYNMDQVVAQALTTYKKIMAGEKALGTLSDKAVTYYTDEAIHNGKIKGHLNGVAQRIQSKDV
jgi:UDP-galactopyranose mutase